MPALPITPPSARPGPAPRSSGPPGAASPGDFAALLTQTTARTAPAEGPKTRAASGEPRRDDDHRVRHGRDDDGAHGRDDLRADAAHGRDDQAAAPAQDRGDAAAQGDDGQGSGTVPPVQDGQDAVAGDAQGTTAQDAGGQVPAGTAVPAQGTPAAPVAPKGAGAAASATVAGAQATAADAAVPVVAEPTAGAAQGAPGSPDASAPAGKIQLPAELLAVAGAHVRHLEGKATTNAATPATPVPSAANDAVAQVATPTTAGTSADAGAGAGGNATNNGNPTHNAATPAMPAVGAPAVAAQPAAAHAATPAGGTPQLSRGSLVQAADRVQELVRIATTRAGNARATLQLRPQALGQVDVQLRTTRDGLVATIAAHDRAGLDALQNAGNDLRRLLEAKGVELHRLDLHLQSGADGGASGQADARQASSGRSGAAARYGLDDGEDAGAEDDLILTTAPSTPAGVLVDVQA